MNTRHPLVAVTGLSDFAVMVVSYNDTGLIERMVAPSTNFGV